MSRQAKRTIDILRQGILIQVSSVELERACVSAVANILEAAAVAVPEAGSGPDQLVMFVVYSASGIPDVKEVQRKCQHAIRNDINPLFKLHKVGSRTCACYLPYDSYLLSVLYRNSC